MRIWLSVLAVALIAVPVAAAQVSVPMALVTEQGVGATIGTVTASDLLPWGLSATGISGTGWNCTIYTLSCTRSDALAGGSSYPPITLTVNVSSHDSTHGLTARASAIWRNMCVLPGPALDHSHSGTPDWTQVVTCGNCQ